MAMSACSTPYSHAFFVIFFFIFLWYVGVIGVSTVEYNLTDSLSHLMSQNVSLLSLLEKQMPDSPNGDSRMSSES